MIDFFTYPATASAYALLIVFVVALLISHAALLPLLGYNEIRWQYIDYVWLPLALLGLIGAVQLNRSEVASYYVSVWNVRATDSLARMQHMAESYSRTESHLCQKGLRSDFSPPPDIFDAIERDHTSTCDWFKLLRSKLPKSLKDVPPGFEFGSLPVPPNLRSPAASGPAEAIDNLRNELTRYTEAETQTKVHQTEMEPPFLLRLAKYFGPFIIAIALALRITKVTGEIRIKNRKVAHEG
jgi:hypothetical protein